MGQNRKIELAIDLVKTSFYGKTRIGGMPASTHSLRVGLSLMLYKYPIEIILAGFCHDLLEDTEVTYEMLLRMFGIEVADLTKACTFDQLLAEEVGEAQLNERVVFLARNGDLEPLIVKCADALDNLRSNEDLRYELQLAALDSARFRVRAAEECMPDALLTKDLRITVDREKKRLEH